jgi:hypothetical protein
MNVYATFMPQFVLYLISSRLEFMGQNTHHHVIIEFAVDAG